MQLMYNIAGENYMLFEIPLASKKMADKLKQISKKYECIEQGAIVDRGLFSNIITVRLLVPERNIIAFCKEEEF